MAAGSREENKEQIGSLLLGYYSGDRGGLHFAGRVGTGFDSQKHREIIRRLRRIKRQKSPFDGPSGDRFTRAQYVSPHLVAEVVYRRWPAGKQLQQVSFQRLRDDKDPREVVIER